MRSRVITAGLLFIWLMLVSIVVPLEAAEVKSVDYKLYPDRVKIIFRFTKPVKLIFYTINRPPQLIADIIGNAFISKTNVPEIIPINYGEIKGIKIFKDELLPEKITPEGKSLYGIDFFIVELHSLVDFNVTKDQNTYCLYLAKEKSEKLKKEQPAEPVKPIRSKSPKVTLSSTGPKVNEKPAIEAQLKQTKKTKPENKKEENKNPKMSRRQKSRQWRELGYRYQKSNNFEKALECYNKAIMYDSNYACAHNDLGINYYYLDEPAKAIKEFEKALKINPNYLGAYSNLAIVYEGMGKLDKAIEFWKKRLQKSKKHDYWTERAKQKIEELKEELKKQ